ncbi:CBS domain-containing protein [Nonomuraea sp. NPDC050310]|uniref:CBS domain-containing protein n=1 Tax=Nonomuraea sp. NPDC050310 TaxID=3154935 RepID=UPI0033E30430
MLAREVMSSPVITVRRTDPVRQAVRLLHDLNITAAPVLDEDGRLAGIVSELDLLTGEFEPDPRAHALPVQGLGAPPPRVVGQVMTEQVMTVTEITDIATVVDLMIGKRFKSVPVLRGERIVGIISRRDLLALLARTDRDLRRDIVQALREQYPHGPRWTVTVHDGVAFLDGPADERARRVAEVITSTVPGVVRVEHRRNP